MIQRILAYHLAFLILFTNIGMPIFTHICHGQGTVQASLLLPTGGCCSKKQASKKSCHAAKSCKKPGLNPKPCCENRVSLASADSSFTNNVINWSLKNLVDIFNSPATPIANFVVSTFSRRAISFLPHAPPLQLHGRSLLVFKQTFLC